MVYADNYRVTTVPSSEPITLQEAKSQIRVTGTDEDTYINSLIQVSREFCEMYENRSYIEQTVTANYTKFGSKIYLPLNPVISITSISYIDSTGTTQTVDSSNYNLQNYNDPAFIYPDYGYSYPTVQNITNSITIMYQAGYSTVPEATKQAILLVLSHLFEHREENSEIALTEMPLGAKNLLFNRVF